MDSQVLSRSSSKAILPTKQPHSFFWEAKKTQHGRPGREKDLKKHTIKIFPQGFVIMYKQILLSKKYSMPLQVII